MSLATSTPAVVKFTVGAPGSGKSYTRTRWIIEHFIPNEEGVLYTNLPLNVDVIIEYFVKKGYNAETIKSRIHVIPKEELELWKKTDKDNDHMPIKNPAYVEFKEGENSEDLEYFEERYKYVGPWVYFQDKDLLNAHLLFDEIQKTIHSKSNRNHRTLYGDWLSTLRHCGCTIEFMTQKEDRVPKEIKTIAETRLDVVSNRGHRLKYLPILNYDYYQLSKGLFDFNLNSSTVYESVISAGGKLKRESSKKYRFDPFYFKFYNTTGESSAKDTRKKEEHEKLSKSALIGWFLKRNFPQCILACIYGYLFYFICFSGGFISFQHWIQNHIGGNANSIEYKAKKKGMTIEEYKRWDLTEHIKKQLNEESEKKALLLDEKYNKEMNTMREELKELKLKRVSAPPLLDHKTGKAITEEPEEDPEVIKERELTKQKKDYFIVFLPESESYALLKNGMKIKKGSVFKKGPYEGLIITQISFDDRLILLSNDEELSFE